ncbi:MAG: glycosyltransferase [Patescibacteria group bacterium]|nr:glycosyltransferase [Patescibacteria group bacterium]
MPKISTVIPTYNTPELVLRVIRSVLAQTYRDFETIVVDDSRNEDTANSVRDLIVKKYTWEGVGKELNKIYSSL